MATLRELKGRIGSVASSEKITGAMKMISSAKMHKAEGTLKRLQPYRKQIETVISSLLSSDAEFTSPLLVKREIKNRAIIVFGSDDGLCGAYNVNIAKYLAEELKADKNVTLSSTTVFAVGSKMFKALRRLGNSGVTIETAKGVDSKSEGELVSDYISVLKEMFMSAEFDRIDVVYMNYISASRQRPKTMGLLPVERSEFELQNKGSEPFIFEPNAEVIIAEALPMYLNAVMEDVFTENRASEQAARVMAMQSANDNAKKLLDQLRLEYNKLRQQAITNELLDIVGGQVR